MVTKLTAAAINLAQIRASQFVTLAAEIQTKFVIRVSAVAKMAVATKISVPVSHLVFLEIPTPMGNVSNNAAE